jgi:ankyrin repeat protein
MGRWFLSTLFAARYNSVRFADSPATQSAAAMVTRLIVEQVKTGYCEVKGDCDYSLVGAIIRGAEDCARLQSQQKDDGDKADVSSSLQRNISSLISAAVDSLDLNPVLGLLAGISGFYKPARLKEGPSNSCAVALVAAARVGDVGALKFLINERGADVNGMTMFFGMPLHAAASGGQISAMETLLEKGAELERKDLQKKRTALHYAAMGGHEAAVALLLQVGADPDAKDKNYKTPLCLAVSQGHVAVTKLLLGQGLSGVDDEDFPGALTLAIQRNHVDVVKQLVRRPELNINESDYNWSMTPLEMAADYGRASIVELLLQRLDIDVDGANPLTAACERGHLETVKILLASPKVNRNLRYGSGFTPLITAACEGSVEVVRALLACDDIDVNARTTEWPGWDGWSALSKAATYGHDDVVRLLLEDPRVQVDTREGGGYTPLSMAADCLTGGHIAEMLLARGADANSQNESGNTPLARAVKARNPEVAAVLLNHPGIQVNLPDSGGETPWTKAAKRGDAEVVTLLMDHPEIQIHIRDDNGMSALMHAAAEWNDEVVGVLLERKEGQEPTPRHIRRAIHCARSKTPKYTSEDYREKTVQRLLGSLPPGSKIPESR